ncbi:hypothetical protein ACWDA3_00340 [Nonomuraea rubra]
MSAPVRDHRGLIAAAISVSITRRTSQERLQEMGAVVTREACELFAALGLPLNGWSAAYGSHGEDDD